MNKLGKSLSIHRGKLAGFAGFGLIGIYSCLPLEKDQSSHTIAYDRLAALDGKIVRPAIPTSFKEIMCYYSLISTSNGLHTIMMTGTVVGGVFGAAAVVVATRGVLNRWKRFASRIIFIPIVGGATSTFGFAAAVTSVAYSLRGNLSEVLVPVGPVTDAVVRSILPAKVVSFLEFSTPEEFLESSSSRSSSSSK